MKLSVKARRELFWILVFIGCLPLMYLLLMGDGGFVRLRQYQSQLREVRLQNTHLRQEYHSFLGKIEKLKTDPNEVERVARELYNFARQGDIIITLPE